MASDLKSIEPGVTPGVVCSHTHLYSVLARGMPAPRHVAHNFAEILTEVWWWLDRAIDEETLYWSAKFGAVEALESGTTALIDHHASPNFIDGSLDVVAKAVKEVGLRINTCYEITERNGGRKEAKAGLAETERFIKAGGKGMVGGHACLTISDETLDDMCALAKSLGVGVHIHVAEDVTDSGAGARLLERSQDNWLIVHGVHLREELKGTIAHNPASNLNNSVGYAAPRKWEERGKRVVLGTDGIGASMLDEARLAFYLTRSEDVTVTPEVAYGWLENGRELFPEANEDRVWWNYQPMSAWDLAYTPNVRPLKAEVDGRVIFENGEPTLVDAKEVRAKAREAAKKLHAKMEAL